MFANTALPAKLITFNIVCNHSTFKKGYAFIAASFVSEPPSPSNKPAAGNIAIGSIKALPNCENFLNIS